MSLQNIYQTNRRALFVLTIAILTIVSAASIAGTYSGGNGLSEATAYQISTPVDWVELVNTPADWQGKHFLLTENIDLDGITTTPIGNDSLCFSGAFNGGGHTISNAVIILPETDYVGLFGNVDYDGKSGG